MKKFKQVIHKRLTALALTLMIGVSLLAPATQGLAADTAKTPAPSSRAGSPSRAELDALIAQQLKDAEGQLKPPMGWSSWNPYHQNINETKILSTANKMNEKGLRELGYVYINLDDAWQASTRDENGRLMWDVGNFPTGSDTVAKLNDLGYRVGLYSSTGTLTCEDLPGSLGYEELDAQTLADWGVEYLKYDYCHVVDLNTDVPNGGNIWPTGTPAIQYLGLTPLGDGTAAETRYVLGEMGDTILTTGAAEITDGYLNGLSNNGGKAFITVNAPAAGTYTLAVGYNKTAAPSPRFAYAEIGGEKYELWFPRSTNQSGTIGRVDVKVELTQGSNEISLYNPIDGQTSDAIVRYTRMSNALKDAVANKPDAPPILFALCEHGRTGAHNWGPGVGNMWRTTHDITTNWNGGGGIMARNYEGNVGLWPSQRPGGYNDPDSLEVGVMAYNTPEGLVKSRSNFHLWAMMSSPLILGMTNEAFDNTDLIDIISDQEIIALDQDDIMLQASRVSTDGGIDILVKPLAYGEVAICFFNKGTADSSFNYNSTAGATARIDLSALYRLDSRVALAVEDEYLVKELTADGSSYVAQGNILESGAIPAFGTVIYRIKNLTSVSPASVSVKVGTGQTFTAKAWTDSVTWSVEGASSTDTQITQDGLLTVGADETAAALTVKASSATDASVYGTAAVTVAKGDVPAGITGPDRLELPVGYGAATVSEFTVTGTNAGVAVTGEGTTGTDPLIKWNNTANSLEIAPGLDSGVYELEITVSGTGTPVTHFFTLTVKAREYAVNVIDGETDMATAAPGDTVTIYAQSAGKVFRQWRGDSDLVFADANLRQTTFVMPAHDVTVQALFNKEGIYSLVDESGTGWKNLKPTNNMMLTGTDQVSILPTGRLNFWDGHIADNMLVTPIGNTIDNVTITAELTYQPYGGQRNAGIVFYDDNGAATNGNAVMISRLYASRTDYPAGSVNFFRQSIKNPNGETPTAETDPDQEKVYLKIVKTGTKFQTFVSYTGDENDWTQIGPDQTRATLAQAANLAAGVWVSNDDGIGTYDVPAVIENFRVNGELRPFGAPTGDPFSNDAALKSLTVSEGTLSPAFAPATTEYTVDLDADVRTIQIGAVANDADAYVTGTGKKDLQPGVNKFTLTVNAEDGTVRDYLLTVNRGVYHTITWHPDGGTPEPTLTQVVDGGTIREPAPMAKTDYTFDGWYQEDTFTNKVTFPVPNVQGEQEFFAKWRLNGNVGIGAQQGGVTSGYPGTATYEVTTANIDDGTAIGLDAKGVIGVSLDPSTAATTGDSTVIRILTTAETPAGNYDLALTVGNITKTLALTVDEPGAERIEIVPRNVLLDLAATKTAALTVKYYSAVGQTSNGSVIWSSNNKAVADVDAQGKVTAGTDIGSATITARLADNAAVFAYCWVTVVDTYKAEPDVPAVVIKDTGEGAAEHLDIDGEKENTYTIIDDLGDSAPDKTLEAVQVKIGGNLTNIIKGITWKSDNTKVVKVKAVSRTNQVTLDYTGTGTATVTATSKDDKTVSAKVIVTVRDQTPKLTSAGVVLYKGGDGVDFTVLPSDNMVLDTAQVNAYDGLKLVANPKGKDMSGNFTVAKSPADTDGTTYRLKLAGTGINKEKKGSYTVYLQAVKGTEAVGVAFPLKVSYVVALPKPTVKLPALNPFWNENIQPVTVSGKDLPPVTGIELTTDGTTPVPGLNFRQAAGSGRWYAEIDETFTAIKTVTGTLKVTYELPGGEGVREVSYLVNKYKLPVKVTAPKLTLNQGTQFIDVTAEEKTATFNLSGGTVAGVAKSAGANAKTNIAIMDGIQTDTDTNTFKVTLTDNAADVKASNPLMFDVMLAGARQPVAKLKATMKTVEGIPSGTAAVSVKAERDKIDLLNPDSRMAYRPTLKNTLAYIQYGRATADPDTAEEFAVRFALATDQGQLDKAKERFNITYEDGLAVITVRPDAPEFIKNESFKVLLEFRLSDGTTLKTKAITIKPTQSKAKHSIPKTSILFQSRTGVESHIVIDMTASSPNGARIKSLRFKEEKLNNRGVAKYVNNPGNAYWYFFDEISQQLHVWIKDSAWVKPGKPKLTFSAIYEGQWQEKFKPVNGTETVTQEKPVDIKIPLTIQK